MNTIRVDANPDQRFARNAFDGTIGNVVDADWWVMNGEIVPGQARARVVSVEVANDGTHAFITLEAA